MINVKIRTLIGLGGVLPKPIKHNLAALNIVSPYDKLIPGRAAVVMPLGFTIELPEGYEAQIRSCVSLASRGVTIATSPNGVFPGNNTEVKVILHNHRVIPHMIYEGDEIAMLVFSPITQIEIS